MLYATNQTQLTRPDVYAHNRENLGFLKAITVSYISSPKQADLIYIYIYIYIYMNPACAWLVGLANERARFTCPVLTLILGLKEGSFEFF